MGELPFRRTYSAAVIEIGNNLSLLPVWARDDQPDLAATSASRIQKLLIEISEDFEPHRHLFAASGGPGDVIRLRHRFYASAHDAILGESKAFMDFFWFHVDAEGREETVAKALGKIECSEADRSRSLKIMAHSSDIDTSRIVEGWPRAKAGIEELLPTDWRNEFAPMNARAFREFSYMTLTPGNKRDKANIETEGRKQQDKKRGRKAVSIPKADQDLIDHWYSAKSSGSRKDEFEAGRGLEAGAVDDAMARMRTRKSRLSKRESNSAN